MGAPRVGRLREEILSCNCKNYRSVTLAVFFRGSTLRRMPIFVRSSFVTLQLQEAWNSVMREILIRGRREAGTSVCCGWKPG